MGFLRVITCGKCMMGGGRGGLDSISLQLVSGPS
jgi:hypothetical protein